MSDKPWPWKQQGQVKLHLFKHIWEVKSFRQQMYTQNRAKPNWFENTSGPQFAKWDFRNVMLKSGGGGGGWGPLTPNFGRYVPWQSEK